MKKQVRTIVLFATMFSLMVCGSYLVAGKVKSDSGLLLVGSPNFENKSRIFTQNQIVPFFVEVGSREGDMNVVEVLQTCSCLTISQKDIPSISKGSTIRVGFEISTGTQVGDIHHQITFRAINHLGIEVTATTDIFYSVESDPVFYPKSKGAVKFSNDDRYRFSGKLCFFHGESLPSYTTAQFLAESDFLPFRLDSISEKHVNSGNGVVCDTFDFELSTAQKSATEKTLTLGLGRKLHLPIKVDFVDASPITCETDAIFLGLRDKKIEFEASFRLKNISINPVVVKNVQCFPSGLAKITSQLPLTILQTKVLKSN